MGDVFKKIRGIVGAAFQFNKGTGPQIKDSSSILELRNAADNAFVLGRSDLIPASGETVNDIVPLLDLKGRVADIEFSFDGASAPSPGANTGKFGFVHTTGGSHTAGQVVYDDGASLILIPFSVVKHLTTRTAITGTISLNSDGFYAYQGGTWTLKGDGAPTSTGLLKSIRIDYAFGDGTKTSTTTIPAGATVVRTRNVVTTLFNGTAPTLTVKVDGTADESLMVAGDSNLKAVGEYHNEDAHDIVAGTTGVLSITLTPDSSSAGVGYVIAEYVTPSA